MVGVIDAPGPVPGETVEELRLHLRKSHPTSEQGQLISGLTRESKQQTFARLASDPPQVIATLGPANVATVMQSPWPSTRILFAGVGEHGIEVLRRQLQAPLEGGVIETCPLETLLLLVGKVAPGARRLGWIKPAADPLSGSLWSALLVAVEARGQSIERFDLSESNQPALASFVDSHDAMLLLYPMADLGLRKASLQGVIGRHRPLFACDAASVAAGAVAGITADAQQIGEALGKLSGEALDQKPPRQIIVESGLIAANLQSACFAGVDLPPEMIARAIVYEKSFDCPPTTPPATSHWQVLLLGTLGSGLLALVASRARWLR